MHYFALLVALLVVSVTLAMRAKKIHSSRRRPASEQGTVSAYGPAIDTGYLVLNYYAESDTNCTNGVKDGEWIALGFCGVYHADYSNPDAPPQGCGSYVKAVAYDCNGNCTGSDDSSENTYISYVYYTDSACTQPGDNTLYDGQCEYGLYTSVGECVWYTNSVFTDTYTPPTVGLVEAIYNNDQCSGIAFNGFFSALGCTEEWPGSYLTQCQGNNYVTTYYDTTTCTGPPDNDDDYDYTIPGMGCTENVMDDEDDADPTWGLGYMTVTCTDGSSSGGNNNGLSKGAIAGIVIAAVFATVAAACGVWFFLAHGASSGATAAGTSAGAAVAKAATAPQANPVLQGKHGAGDDQL